MGRKALLTFRSQFQNPGSLILQHSKFLLKSSLRGEKLGFAIELQPSWDSQVADGIDEPFYWGEA